MSAKHQFEFDPNAYSLIAIQKACHRCSSFASFEITQESTNSAIVAIATLRSNAKQEKLEQLLRTEALDQQMREVVRQETSGVRNLILAHAFSRTGLIHDDGAYPERPE